MYGLLGQTIIIENNYLFPPTIWAEKCTSARLVRVNHFIVSLLPNFIHRIQILKHFSDVLYDVHGNTEIIIRCSNNGRHTQKNIQDKIKCIDNRIQKYDNS